MMNSQKNAMECAVSMASESEFLKAMDAKKQGNEPLASEELAELLRRTEHAGVTFSRGTKQGA